MDGIRVATPPEWDMQVDEHTDGVQISPLALLYIKGHIDNLVYQREHPDPQAFVQYNQNPAPNFKSSTQIRILEFGGGCSTIFFAKAFPFAQICVIEGEREWYDRINQWLSREKIWNVRIFFEEQPSDYGFGSKHEDNLNYVTGCRDFGFPFDLILNDGAMREKVGDMVLDDGRWLSVGGLYLRHDYERALDENWIGPHIDPKPDWVTGDVGCFYENFCQTHPGYKMVTVPGNGKWGLYCEYGGVWRRK